MSHLIQGTVSVKDIEALRKAAATFGATLEASKTFNSYSGDQNVCEYRIALPGVAYQIGAVRQPDGTLVLAHDPYGYANSRHDGHKLVEKFGGGLAKLQAQYARQATIRSAKRAGYLVREKTLTDGSFRLQLVRA